MIFLGLDWSEEHHDVAVLDEAGNVLGELRIADTIDGVASIHELVGRHEGDPSQVVVGTESVHHLVLQALVASGYVVYEINPMAASRYRERHHLSGAKSDRADAKMLADAVRTDRHNHRPHIGDSDLAEGIKVLARTHKTLIQERQTQVNHLRSTLRQYYPAMLLAFPGLAVPSERDSHDAMALLERAPTPAQGRVLTTSQIIAALRSAGRQRNLEQRAAAIRTALRQPQLESPPRVTRAYGGAARATARIVHTITVQIDELAQELADCFEEHPDAKIILSLPGLGPVLGARALGEFGDEPSRYANARARKNYATTSPVTKASGKQLVVAARRGGNRHLGDACLRWAFCALQSSPGARRYYDALRARQKTNGQALRAVANRMVGILHACLAKRELYDEAVAWPVPVEAAAAAA
jgi:transposase